MGDRKCSKCKEYKPNNLFIKGRAQCKICRDIYHAHYRANNKNKINDGMKLYFKNNKEKILECQRKYRKENSEKISAYNKNYINTRFDYKEYKRNWQKNKLINDPSFKLRRNISRLINFKINKNSKSSFKYLPYTVQELKKHIESQFEPWMTWDNWGSYRVKLWDDDDISTWTWQIDHIICQADLPYDSMDHINFKKCWALCNLRPYSSKSNLIDGVKRLRHKE